MKRISGLTLLLSVLLSVVMVAVSCNKMSEKIQIGVISSLTGTIAPYGKRALEGIELAVDEVNKSGGIAGRQIDLIIEDDKSLPRDAVLAFRKLVDIDRVPVILGPVGSSQAMVCAPVANEKKVVEFSPAAATPMYTDTGDYTFRNRASATLEVEVMADVAYENLDLRKMAIIYINNDVGVGFYPIFKKEFESLGGKIVTIESFEQGSTDMRSQLAKIDSFNPDGIYLIGHVIESGYVLKQAKEMGIKARFTGHLALEGPDLFKIAGDAANGVVYTATGYDANSKDPRVQSFEIKYRARYKKAGDVFAATAYDAVYILKLSIEIGGYDAEGIKNALYGIKNYPGVSGSTSFDRHGDVEKPVMIKMVKSRQFVVLEDISKLN